MGDELALLKPLNLLHDAAPRERIVYKVNSILGLADAIEHGVGSGYLPCFVSDRTAWRNGYRDRTVDERLPQAAACRRVALLAHRLKRHEAFTYTVMSTPS